MIGTLSNGKDMRRDFITPLSTVDTDCPHGVNGEPLVWVYSNTEETRVCVDQPFNITHLQVEQDRGIVEISQVGHVFAKVIFGRIHLM